MFKKIKSISNIGKLKIQKQSPNILLALGLIGFVATVVLACKETMNVEEIIKEQEEKLDKITEVEYENNHEGKQMQDKDILVVKVSTKVKLVTNYTPAILVGIGSIGCILMSHKILNSRYIGVCAAYTALHEEFKTYKKNVGNHINDAVSQGYVYDKTTSDVEKLKNISQYAKFFDESCSEWDPMPGYNLTFLKGQQNYANDRLKLKGHIFLNEVYDLLGIPRTKAGAVVGWINTHGDSFVDFGIFRDPNNVELRDFVNGYEPSILLDFNVDGVIYDLI